MRGRHHKFYEQALADARHVSFDDVADGIRIEQVADRHLEQIPLLRRLGTIEEKVLRHID